MSLSIRNAERADAALILSLIADLADYEKLSHEVTASADDIARALFCDAPKAFCLIAQWDGEPCGFALYFFNFSTFLGKHGVYLEDLFVKPAFRGKGVGKALLSELARIAQRNDCGRLEWAVLDWNEPAIRFYKSLGAAPMEEWSVFRLTGGALDDLAGGAS
ncbi:MAG: GNAT family N-acetyltransferase [Parvularculaceae bacterium]|nr:GNAT family N-acetyltransferase [Parvularculaceae bacterium]